MGKRMAELRLSDLIIYPLKSAAGLHPSAWPITERGLRFDRHWMVVDEQGRFVTQREVPRLALVVPSFEENQLVLSAPGLPPLPLPLEMAQHAPMQVRIWSESCWAVPVGAEADAWISSALKFSCRIARQHDEDLRQVDLNYAQPGDQVGFADGFPFLLATEASLDDLNGRLPSPLPMNRFRPNLVISGTVPYAEDSWRKIRIGAINFRLVKPCARCSITTVDQATGEIGREPLKTLSTYRRVGGKVMFAQNAIHDGLGTIHRGDVVLCIEGN